MADTDAEARLRFLHASAHLYSATAPATSAQLMLQWHIEVATSTRPGSNDGSTSSCKACGTVLLPGLTSQVLRVQKRAAKVVNQIPKSKRHRRGQHSALFEKHVRVKCLACHRFEDTPIQKTSTSRKSRMVNATLPVISPSGTESHLNPESNPSEKSTKPSKRRERFQKHKGGLQAMLKKSRAPAAPSSGFGLDLMDLMKQS